MLLTDSNNKVVIDKSYKDYAAMISSDGKAGGNYTGENRIAILTSLIPGISADQFNQYETTSSEKETAYNAMIKAAEARDKVLERQSSSKDAEGLTTFINSLISNSSEKISTYEDIEKCVPQIKDAISPFLLSKDKTALDEACKTVLEAKKPTSNAKIEETTVGGIVNAIANALGDVTVYASGKNSSVADYEAADAAYKEAKETYDTAANNNNTIFTEDIERKIAFYDQIFTAIAENGWKEDYNVTDNDYLNQMLQNIYIKFLFQSWLQVA